MAEPIQRVTHEDLHYDFAGLMAHEMVQVQQWTGSTTTTERGQTVEKPRFENRREFEAALRAEAPMALMAAFGLAMWRRDDKKPRWDEIRVDLSALQWSYHVEGREVEFYYETDDDGHPLLVAHDETGRPRRNAKGEFVLAEAGAKDAGFVVKTHEDGRFAWRYVDTGEDVPPTPLPVTRGSTGSRTTATKPARSGSGSGTPKTSAA